MEIKSFLGPSLVTDFHTALGQFRNYHLALTESTLIDIRDGKIWIQQDGTEVGVATLLVEWGVPKEAIVLAFHAPYKRPYTGFATE